MDSAAPTYEVSDDPARVDRDLVWRWLHDESYWAAGRPREVFERSLDNSLVFGVYESPSGEQAGFLRVVTDRATFAWICDVFVLAPHRGRGLAHLLLDAALSHPDMAGLKRVVLGTRDAHELYRDVGFVDLPHPERWMQLVVEPSTPDRTDDTDKREGPEGPDRPDSPAGSPAEPAGRNAGSEGDRPR